MKIFALLFFGLIATVVTAFEGDYELLKGLGTILLYAIVIIPLLIFLAYTGVGGLILLIIVCSILAGIGNSEN